MPHVHESSHTPSRFLVDNLELLPEKGRVLDLAMGNGRNAIYLAERGFTVEGVDISREAVDMAIESARQAGVSIDARVADLESDCYIERNSYDVIICFNYLQRSLIPQIKEGIKAGGMVIYETFIVDQKQFGHPQNPDYLLKHNELLDMFREFRCLRYREGVIDDKVAIASIIAQKVEVSK